MIVTSNDIANIFGKEYKLRALNHGRVVGLNIVGGMSHISAERYPNGILASVNIFNIDEFIELLEKRKNDLESKKDGGVRTAKWLSCTQEHLSKMQMMREIARLKAIAYYFRKLEKGLQANDNNGEIVRLSDKFRNNLSLYYKGSDKETLIKLLDSYINILNNDKEKSLEYFNAFKKEYRA